MKNNDAFYLTVPLVKFIEKDVNYSGNYLVYGQGGFGKTTSMLMLFKYLLSKAENGENIVPIYIDSKGLDFTYEKPVFEYIIREYCGLNKDISQHIETLNDLLKNNDKKYYIIIDAINEAESNKFKVIRDIASLKEIFDKNRAGQLIVSSRTDENVYCFNDFKRIKMLDFKDEQIVDFLNKYNFKNNGKSIDKIDVERIDKNLLKILRVPMFLKIFKDVYKDADVFPDLYKKNIIHESDLLCKFVDKIIDDKIGMHKAEQSPEYIKAYFALNRFLPAIAFELAKNDEFSISESVLDDLFKNKFNESYFKQFQNRRENYFKYAGDLDDLLNDCIDGFSFIVCKGENKNVEYSFSHPVWRDYFSAVYLATSMDYDVINEFEYQISNNIQQYVGEIVREYEFENKTDILSSMSPIEAFMQRNCNTLSPLAVRLCIEIMKKSRNGKLTAKYNHLDLRYINFYDYDLQGSSFDNSKIYEHNFIPQGHNGQVNSVCYSPDGKRIVSCGSDNTIRIWDAETGKQIGEPLEGHTYSVYSVRYSPDGKRIVSGGYGGMIKIWDAETGKQICRRFRGHTEWVNSVCYSPDGKQIVSGSDDGTIRIWNVETGKQIGGHLEGHTDSVNSVCYSPDGKRIVSGSDDNTIQIWDAKTGERIGEPFEGHTASVDSVCYSPDGKRIVSGSRDKSIRIWNAETGEQIGKTLKGYPVCYSPVGKRIVSGSNDNTIQIWDADTGKQIGNPLKGHVDWVNSVCYSPDGKRIASGSSDGTIRIWDAGLGRQLCDSLGGGCVNHDTSVSYSPDGTKMVFSNLLDKTIHILNTKTGEYEGKPFKGHTNYVTSVCYSPDGKRIVSGSFDNTIRIWNEETGNQIGKPFRGHTGPVHSVCYSHDGKRIVSSSWDGTIRIWNVETRTQIGKPLEIQTDDINWVFFSPDRKSIIGECDDGTIQIWNLETHSFVILKGKTQSNIQNCDFKNAIFNVDDINDFCHILYCNGADVPKEYEPKPIPFEWNDEELSDKESE